MIDPPSSGTGADGTGAANAPPAGTAAAGTDASASRRTGIGAAPGQASPDVRQAAEQLMPLFYADVHRLARRERRRVGAGDMLQTTALIHEAYLKLRTPTFNDRAHFLRASALAMRHVLINHAREQLAEKRGGGAIVESLVTAHGIGLEDDRSLLDVHDALERLARLDPRLAEVVECRFFAGFSEEDTALALGISDRTVRRDWTKARAWLRVALSGDAPLAPDAAP